MVNNSKFVINNFKILAGACIKTNSFSYANGIKAIITLLIFSGHCLIKSLGFPKINGKFVEDLKNSLFFDFHTLSYVIFEEYFILGGMFTYKTLEKEYSKGTFG